MNTMESSLQTPSVTLTDRAAERISAIMTKAGKGTGLRFGVKTGGCSGFTYIIELAETIGPNDSVFEHNGVKVMVDRDCLDQVAGTEIDYRKEGLNETFRFSNPKAKESCGCGESFAV